MDEGTTTVAPTTPMPAACTCTCTECAMDKNCAACSHKMSDEGCNCEGCMCNMEAPEPPMAM